VSEASDTETIFAPREFTGKREGETQLKNDGGKAASNRGWLVGHAMFGDFA
jgi:hypothetical protein